MPSASELSLWVSPLSRNKLIEFGFCYDSGDGVLSNDLDEIIDASKDLYESKWGRYLEGNEDDVLEHEVESLYDRGYFTRVCK